MNIKQFSVFIDVALQIAIENETLLCDLDSQNGDGDLGITFKKIMSSMQTSIRKYEGVDIGDFLFNAGSDIIENAASTMGTLFASGIIQAGKELKGKEELFHKDFVTFYSGLIAGIEKRGKAIRGDKTILDTLYPIKESLENHKSSSKLAAFEVALQTADKAVEETKNIKAKHGRAARYENKSVGLVDSGSMLAKLLTEAFVKYLKNES